MIKVIKMAKPNNPIKRVNIELVNEIERIARENCIKFTEASKEAARLIKNNKGKRIKLIREIRF